MRVLIVNHMLPFPPMGGGDLRTYHLIRALASRHEVTVVGFACDDERELMLPPFPVRTFDVAWEWPPLYRDMLYGDDSVSQAAYAELLSGTEEPWFVSCRQSRAMEETLRRVSREGFDLVVLEHSDMARFLPALPPEVPKVLDLHNVHALMAERAAEGKSGEERELALAEAERTRRFERKVASQCQLCAVCSESEAQAARRLLGIDRAPVVPNGVDTAWLTPGDRLPTAGYLLFTGTMDYAPNVEAVQYFVAEVLPAVRRQSPGVSFHIVGVRPEKAVEALATDDVIVHGAVPDMRPYYREAAVVVVPLLRGGGTRLKILEAAACQKAIVSTPLGAEGLDFRAGEDLVLAGQPAEFADAIVALLRDAERCRQLGYSARNAARRYEWQDIGQQFCRLVEELVATVEHRPETARPEMRAENECWTS